jgi:hypothetical protein
MSENDPIRRGDVFDIIHGVGEFTRDVVDAHIDNLPADPRAAAAVRLAEVMASDLDPAESTGVEAWDAALAAWRSLAREPAKPAPLPDLTFDADDVLPEMKPEPAPERCPECGGSGNAPGTSTSEDGCQPCPRCAKGGSHD